MTTIHCLLNCKVIPEKAYPTRLLYSLHLTGSNISKGQKREENWLHDGNKLWSLLSHKYVWLRVRTIIRAPFLTSYTRFSFIMPYAHNYQRRDSQANNHDSPIEAVQKIQHVSSPWNAHHYYIHFVIGPYQPRLT